MVVDAVDKAAALYGHFGFHGLDGHRPWRRLGDDAGLVALTRGGGGGEALLAPGSVAPWTVSHWRKVAFI